MLEIPVCGVISETDSNRALMVFSTWVALNLTDNS